MKVSFKLFIIMSLLTIPGVQAQDKKGLLSVGDDLPSVQIPKLIHANNKKINTNDFKNDLLIIDFWATSCKSCIEALPGMEILEKKIGHRLTILPVTSQPADYILEFWKKNKYTKRISKPSVVEDKIFRSFFPFNSLPHEVWIYKGKVIGITDIEYVNEENIRKVLKDEKVNFITKYDFYSHDRKKPLFTIDGRQINISSNNKLKYAAVSDFREKVNTEGFTGGSGIIRDTANKTVRAYFLNQPILNSYFLEWYYSLKPDTLITPVGGLTANTIDWQVNDRSQYFFEKKQGVYTQEWVINNAICFESFTADTGQTDQEIHRSIIAEMDRLLGLHVRWEKRKEKVWVIVKGRVEMRDLKLPKTNGEKVILYDLTRSLNGVYENPYVFNESGSSNAEILIESNSLNNIDKIRSALHAGGFELKEEMRSVHHLVFTETDGGRLVNAENQSKALQKRKYQINLSSTPTDSETSFLEANKKKTGMNVTASGLQYKVLVDGTGKTPSIQDKVLINYEGSLINGKVFESSLESGLPSEFNVKDMIRGWIEAVQMMKEGTKWEIFLPAELAYGEHTNRGRVPANSPVVYKIELVKIIDKSK